MPPRPGTAKDRREAAQARRARRAEVIDPDVVMEAAAAFLAVRPRTVAETRSRLQHLGYPAALCDEVVQRLVELGYLDDRAFAQTWVESRDRARPRGVMALRRELLSKGVPRDIVDEALSARAELAAHPGLATHSELATHPELAEHPGTVAGARNDSADMLAARRLLERRAATLCRETDPRRRRHKAYALLARHGFTPDVCQEVAGGIADPGTGLTDEGV